MTKSKLLSSKIVAGLGLFLFLTVGLTTSIILSQQNQDNRSQASECPSAADACTSPGTKCVNGNKFRCDYFSRYCTPDGVWRPDGSCSTDSGGGSNDGGSNDGGGGGGTSYDHTACTNKCQDMKDEINGGVVAGRRKDGKNDGGVPNCECYCSVGEWNNTTTYSACVGSGGGGTSDDGGNSSSGGMTGSAGTLGKGLNENADGTCKSGYWKACGNCLADVCTPNTSASYTCDNLIREYCGVAPCYETGTCETCSEGTQPRCAGSTLQHCVFVDGVYVWQTRETDSQSCDGSGDGVGTGGPIGGAVDSDDDGSPDIILDEGGYGTPQDCTSWKIYECSLDESAENCREKYIGDEYILDDALRIIRDFDSCKQRTAVCIRETSGGRPLYYSAKAADSENMCDGYGTTGTGYEGVESSCSSGEWNVYQCVGSVTNGNCHQTLLRSTVSSGIAVDIISEPFTCRTRQATCVEDPSVYYYRENYDESTCKDLSDDTSSSVVGNWRDCTKWDVNQCDGFLADGSCSGSNVASQVEDLDVVRSHLSSVPECKTRQATCVWPYAVGIAYSYNYNYSSSCGNTNPDESPNDGSGDDDGSGGNAGSGDDTGGNNSPVPLPTIISTIDKCPSDINLDGVTNLADFSLLASDFLNENPGANRTDINRDGVVNLTDFSILASNFLQMCEKTVNL